MAAAGVLVGLLALGERLPRSLAMRALRLLSWTAIAIGVSALAGGQGAAPHALSSFLAVDFDQMQCSAVILAQGSLLWTRALIQLVSRNRVHAMHVVISQLLQCFKWYLMRQESELLVSCPSPHAFNQRCKGVCCGAWQVGWRMLRMLC